MQPEEKEYEETYDQQSLINSNKPSDPRASALCFLLRKSYQHGSSRSSYEDNPNDNGDDSRDLLKTYIDDDDLVSIFVHPRPTTARRRLQGRHKAAISLALLIVFALVIVLPQTKLLTNNLTGDMLAAKSTKYIQSHSFPLSFPKLDRPTYPLNITEAVNKLAAVLGEYAPHDSRQYRIKVSRNEVQQPEEDAPKVRDKADGLTIYGTPYQMGDAACFDIVQHHQRTVFRLDDSGEEKTEVILRRQQRYFLARVSIRSTESGSWEEFQMTFLSHSEPGIIGKTYMMGTMSWEEDGFELHGMATDEVYTADGGLKPCVLVAAIHFSRTDNRLKINDSWQGYHWAKGPQGKKISLPDFDRPIGKPGPWLEGESSPF